MKTKLLTVLAMLCYAMLCYAQVGVNTTSPAATLDIIAKNTTGTSTTVDGLIVPRVDRQRAQSMTAVPTSTLIYVNSVATGTQTGTAINIDAVGLYTYNGAAWTKVSSGGNNIYNADGTLTANRTVTNNGNTLNIAGSASTTTFASNGSVGIGTATPATKLEINNGTTAGAIKIVDGTQGDGKVLIGDVNGVGKWGNITGSWYSYLRGGYLDPTTSSGIERKIDFSSGTVSTSGLGAVNVTTDEITVPYTGKYKVTITGWWGNPLTAGNFLAIVHIKVNGIAVWRPHVLGNTVLGGTCVSFTTLMDINANDVLTVYNQEDDGGYARQVGYSSANATGAGKYYPAQLLVEYLGN